MSPGERVRVRGNKAYTHLGWPKIVDSVQAQAEHENSIYARRV